MKSPRTTIRSVPKRGDSGTRVAIELSVNVSPTPAQAVGKNTSKGSARSLRAIRPVTPRAAVRSGTDHARLALSTSAAAAARVDNVASTLPPHQVFRNEMGDCFVTIRLAGHAETWPVRSPRVRYLLRQGHRARHGHTPPPAALNAATESLVADAAEGPVMPTWIRAGEAQGCLYLDLCNDGWQAVRITRRGWRIVDRYPVRFQRFSTMQPLPTPVRGGDLADLRPLLNVPDENDWILLVAWMFGILSPSRPHPILGVLGEQDAAKTTTCRLVRQLVDPSEVPLRTLSATEEDLIIAAQHNCVMGFDNVSKITPAMSDALCRLATGAAYATRRKYSNRREVVLRALRPVMLNGIGHDLVRGDDLRSRMLTIHPPLIPNNRRIDERAIAQRFTRLAPSLLGALLDAAVVGLRRLPLVESMGLPRMADFAKWVVAAEPALPWKVGEFLQAYERDLARSSAMRLDGEPLYRAISTMLGQCSVWHGSAAEFHAVISGYFPVHARNRLAGPIELRGEIERLAPALRMAGINVGIETATGRISLRHQPTTSQKE